MKENFLIFHGTGGSPEENWFPWLKAELEKSGHQMEVPQFPTPEGQSLEAWLNVLKDSESRINRNTILIGHSLGGIFLLRLLERMKEPIKAAIFVGTPVGVREIKNWDSDFAFSGGFSFDWDRIKSNTPRAIVYHSDDDPYVDLGNGEELARQLGVELSLIPNAGHFNARAGYLRFNRLLSDINGLLQQ